MFIEPISNRFLQNRSSRACGRPASKTRECKAGHPRMVIEMAAALSPLNQPANRRIAL